MIDTKTHSYLHCWEKEITNPVMEWARRMDEARLSNDQIKDIFSSASSPRNQQLPSNIIKKIAKQISSSKKIKSFDSSFERMRSKILSKYPNVEKIVDALGKQATAHPIYSAAIIGILATAATMVSGGLGGFAIGTFLKTSNDILKGQSLSRSLMRGVGAGLLGAAVGFGIREVSDWLTHFAIDSSTVPGYTDVVKVKWIHETNGIIDLYIDSYITTESYTKLNKLMELAQQNLDSDNYNNAFKIFKTITRYVESAQPRILDILSDNEELSNKAIESAKKTKNLLYGLAAMLQGAATGIGSKKLSESMVSDMMSGIASWAKKIGSDQTFNVLMKSWDQAGNPTDSDAIHSLLVKAGIPDDVIKDIYKRNNIPMPKAPRSAQQQAPQQIQSGDSNLDDVVNEILKKNGKDAAIKYLIDLRTHLMSTQKQPAHGDIKTASDGQKYRLNIGKTGNRLWINIKTKEAASDAIDAELEGVNP